MNSSPNVPTITNDKVLVRIIYCSSTRKSKGRRVWNNVAIPAHSDYLSTLPMSLPSILGKEFHGMKMEVMTEVEHLLSDDGDYSGWTLYSFKGTRLKEDKYTAEVVITRHVTAAALQTLVSPTGEKEDLSTRTGSE